MPLSTVLGKNPKYLEKNMELKDACVPVTAHFFFIQNRSFQNVSKMVGVMGQGSGQVKGCWGGVIWPRSQGVSDLVDTYHRINCGVGRAQRW